MNDVCVISSGYRFLTGARAVFVVLLVNCRENVVNLVWILWSGTFITYRREELGGCGGRKVRISLDF